MISLTTLALLICSFAIVVFFAQEFLDVFKKIFGFPGVKLFVPLMLASSVIELYEPWGGWLLFRIKMILSYLPGGIAHLFPSGTVSTYLSKIIYLMCFGCLPIWIATYRSRSKGHLKASQFPFFLGLFIWVFLAILLIVP